jgi:polyferredoxin
MGVLEIAPHRETGLRPDAAAPSGSRLDRVLAFGGDWLMRHQSAIRMTQWVVVVVYILLLVVPAVLPLPDRAAHIWTNVTLAAQFAFWGIWWPFVLLSMVLVGRAWCGLLCPEGALTEAVSEHGRGLAVPRWLTWRGWPFVAFAGTTIYGQMVSVYQYPKPVVIVLGGSTLAAMAVGYLYGRSKRVWCRYLCPVNGVFGLLAKLAPVYFKVDSARWNEWTKPRGTAPATVNCAPLVPLKTMQGSNLCHMCGRCSGFRDGAITLSKRSPNDNIVRVAAHLTKPWETVLIAFGMIGLAAGAFHWSSSSWFVEVKEILATWLIDQNMGWALEPILPWWILTNYPDQNDVLSPLDGVVLVGYILASTVLVGGAVSLALAAAARTLGPWSSPRFHHLAQGLIPIAGCGVFLGLSALTVTMLRAEGVTLDWINHARAAILAGAGLWCMTLGWQISARYTDSLLRRGAAMIPMAAATGLGIFAWASLFWKVFR